VGQISDERRGTRVQEGRQQGEPAVRDEEDSADEDGAEDSSVWWC
jgi:hypothetical protein